MFHSTISGLKYLCAKYTFFIHIGEKRLRVRTLEDTRDPQPPKEGEVTTPQPEDVEEGEVMWMLWKKNLISQVQVHSSSSGRLWCAIGIYRRSRKTSMMLKKKTQKHHRCLGRI
ncbi:hypothetical protein AB205_0183690 [Aquarana catesbeiana]|uniref:Uncharacterized protein n=1 Tax=Aquarana catesbeiana TaxID=8400 RepID=A0A2G9QG94_AQUCT|nr:hypothetical protein AB205_0183690 [Aquarana catesbeiana]